MDVYFLSIPQVEVADDSSQEKSMLGRLSANVI